MSNQSESTEPFYDPHYHDPCSQVWDELYSLKDLILRWRKVHHLSRGGWGNKQYKQQAFELLEEIDNIVGFKEFGEKNDI
jgi:hypothetical protein